MTVRKAFLVILASAAAFTIIGTGVGLLLAKVAPGFYAAAFGNSGSPGFDPFELGFGLGLTTGGMVGIGVGAVVVMSIAWCAARQSGPQPAAAQEALLSAPSQPGAVSRSTPTEFFRS